MDLRDILIYFLISLGGGLTATWLDGLMFVWSFGYKKYPSRKEKKDEEER